MAQQKIRVAFLVNYFLPAGLENFVLTLLNRLDRAHFEPSLYIFFKSDESFCARLKKDVPVIHVNRKSGRDFKRVYEVAKRLKVEGIQVLQVHNWGTFIEGAVIKKFYPDLKLVHVQQGMEYELTLNASNFKNSIRRALRKAMVGKFDQIVACSGGAKKYLEQEWGAKNVKLIYNSVDTEKFGSATVFDARSGHDGFSICTVGRTAPVKNFLCLFKAVNILKERIPNLKLYHIGRPPDVNSPHDAELLEYLTANQLDKHIVFLGIQENIPSLLPNFDVFSLTSFSEGLSFSLIEAQAAGLPAVVTNVGGNPEVIVDGENGFLVPSDSEEAVANAIYQLYEDRELRRKMSQTARHMMKIKFDVTNMVKEYEKLYSNIVNRKVT